MGLWTDPGRSPARFGGERRGAGHLQALERIAAWTRLRFALAEGDPVVITEEAGRLPGFPPRETLVTFWSEGTRHHFRVFKPAAEVAEADLPPSWLKGSIAGDGIDCDCC